MECFKNIDEFINKCVTTVYGDDKSAEIAIEIISGFMELNDEVLSNEWEENVAPEMRICGNMTIDDKYYTVTVVKTTAGAEIRFYDDEEVMKTCGIDMEKCPYQPAGWMGWKSPKAMRVHPMGVLRAYDDGGLFCYGFGRFNGKQFILSREFSSIIFDIADYWHCKEV